MGLYANLYWRLVTYNVLELLFYIFDAKAQLGYCNGNVLCIAPCCSRLSRFGRFYGRCPRLRGRSRVWLASEHGIRIIIRVKVWVGKDGVVCWARRINSSCGGPSHDTDQSWREHAGARPHACHATCSRQARVSRHAYQSCDCGRVRETVFSPRWRSHLPRKALDHLRPSSRLVSSRCRLQTTARGLSIILHTFCQYAAA